MTQCVLCRWSAQSARIRRDGQDPQPDDVTPQFRRTGQEGGRIDIDRRLSQQPVETPQRGDVKRFVPGHLLIPCKGT